MRTILASICLWVGALALGSDGTPAVRLGAAPELTDAGRTLIYEFEVGGGEKYYDRFLIHPEWPGFASGITFGVGYDAGYNSPAVIRGDWHVLASGSGPDGQRSLERLVATSGLTGKRAKAELLSVRDIVVRWDLAEGVFNDVTVARWAAVCRRVYPGFDELRPNAQAALLSLTFNRGSSLVGDRRREMRTIRALVPRQDYAGMAGQLRAMKRVWTGTDIQAGMYRRREAEAKLMEQP